jgi:hypothetical protein
MSFNNSTIGIPNNKQVDPVAVQINFYVNLIGYIYMVPMVCICGFVLNIICLAVLCQKELKGNIYKYFIVKTISELVLVVCGAILPMSFCINCATFQTLAPAIYRGYIFTFVVASCFSISNMCEIALTYDRLIIFKQKSSWLPKVSFRNSAVLITTVSMILYAPYLFYLRIVELPNNPGKYTLTWSEFGYTWFYKFYGQFVALYSILLFLILLFLNVFVLIEYKKYTTNRMEILGSVSRRADSMRKKTSIILTVNLNEDYLNEAQTSIAKINQKHRATTISISKRKSQAIEKKEDTEKRLTYSILCCCVIYGFNRLTLALSSIIQEIELIDRNFVGFSSFSIIFAFLSRFLAYVVFSVNLFILALFNKAFKDHLIKLFKFLVFKSSSK